MLYLCENQALLKAVKRWVGESDLILLAFITGNSNLEPLIEGLCAQFNID